MQNRSSKIWLRTVLLWVTLSIVLGGCAQVVPVEHEILVQSAGTDEAIAGAKVKAEMGLRNVVEAVSDADGVARLIIDEEFRDSWTKVTIEADDYQKQSILVELTLDKPTTVVDLQLVGEEITVEEATSQEVTPAEEPAVDGAGADNVAATSAETASVSIDPPPPGELAAIPPPSRANYYQTKPALNVDTSQIYRATIQTSRGNIVVALDATAAPEHVNNFIFLSNEGFYDGLTFHRVEPGFVIQGGDPEGTGQGGPGYTVPGEFALTHIEGALAMARLPDQINPNRESSGSQFYITLAPTEFLDGQYSVFGQVEEGMDVVQSIQIGDAIERIIVQP